MINEYLKISNTARCTERFGNSFCQIDDVVLCLCIYRRWVQDVYKLFATYDPLQERMVLRTVHNHRDEFWQEELGVIDFVAVTIAVQSRWIDVHTSNLYI